MYIAVLYTSQAKEITTSNKNNVYATIEFLNKNLQL